MPLYSRDCVVPSICFCLICLLSHFLADSVATDKTDDLSGQSASRLVSDNSPSLSVLLATGFFPGHLYPITALGEELVKRGHNVTLCATVMEGSDLLPSLPESYGINFVSAGPDNLTQADYEDMIKRGIFKNISMSDVWKFVETSYWPAVKIRSKIEAIGVDQFDVIVCDGSVSPIAVYYSQLGKSAVVLSPLIMFMEATHGGLFCHADPGFCFFGRLSDLILSPLLLTFQGIVFNGVKNFDTDYHKVLKGIDVASYIGIGVPLVVTTAFGFEYPKTRYPLTHYVGPLLMDSFTPLEQQLVEWLSKKPNKSVIYVGMGATGFITAHMAQLIINGVLATDFSVVWALPMSDQDVLEGIDIDRERFYVSKWIPRQALFKHPTLAMTIMHCGMNGVQESLYNGLPIVCVPHAFDHFDVARRVESAKVGIPLYSMSDSLIQGNKFTSENLTLAINTITMNRQYRKEAKKLSKLFKFAGGAKKAADLVEFYSEVGYNHLVPAYVKYEWSWVQYYNIDVYCVLSLIGCLLSYFFYRLLKCCCRCFCSKAKKPKSD